MRHLANIMCTAGALCTLLFASASAHAEGQLEASATGKGIVGGALLGGEVVMLTEAALDVKPGWAYAVGGIAGGIGGGVAGFFVEDSSAKASFYMLAGGMALVIPTTIAVLATTAYQPPADYTEDKGPTDEPVADPPQPGASRSTDAPERTATHTPVRPGRVAARRLELRPPPALVDVGQGLVSLSVPAIEVRDAYTPREMAEFGVEQRTELRVPVLNVLF